jgi:Raf kinase inhibitor-like YbhB/YbcL family protein
MDDDAQNNGLKILSTAFKNGEDIPTQYTCKGDNISPPLNIVNIPAQAKSLALIMHDPDAPVGDYVHWLVWDIQPSTLSIGANSIPVGAVQGITSFNKNEYGGPCPPAGSGTHRYIFELYALDMPLGLPPNTTRDKLVDAMKGHIVEQTALTGLVSASA